MPPVKDEQLLVDQSPTRQGTNDINTQTIKAPALLTDEDEFSLELFCLKISCHFLESFFFEYLIIQY